MATEFLTANVENLGGRRETLDPYCGPPGCLTSSYQAKGMIVLDLLRKRTLRFSHCALIPVITFTNHTSIATQWSRQAYYLD
jgi:hypothetical protein